MIQQCLEAVIQTTKGYFAAGLSCRVSVVSECRILFTVVFSSISLQIHLVLYCTFCTKKPNYCSSRCVNTH